MKLNSKTRLAGMALLVSAYATPAVATQYVLRLHSLFSKLYVLGGPSRTPIYETPAWEVSPRLNNVTKIRVRGLEKCGRSPIGRWNLQSVAINEATPFHPTRFQSPAEGRDEQGAYLDFNLPAQYNVDTLKFRFDSLDSGALPCLVATVEVWSPYPMPTP